MKKNKGQRGITLIALVVTIIVLLILAGVTIQMLTGQNGILKRAGEASEKTGRASVIEQAQIEIAYKETENRGTINKEELHDILKEYFTNVPEVEDEVWDNYPEGFPTLKATEEYGGYDGIEVGSIYKGTLEKGTEKVEVISDESRVGYYADIDDDGTVDGVIFADLAVGGSGTWNTSGMSLFNSYGTYTIPTPGNLKQYKVSEKETSDIQGGKHTAEWGTKDVIVPVDKNDTTKNERFYVMAFEDIDSSSHPWYYTAYDNGISNYSTVAPTGFGKGKTNTKTMIDAWNEIKYGKKNGNSSYPDMWGPSNLQSKCYHSKNPSGKWFVPSTEEWAAFGGELKIDKDNYKNNYNLSERYWSSSLWDPKGAFSCRFSEGYMFNGNLYDGTFYVRLAAAF